VSPTLEPDVSRRVGTVIAVAAAVAAPVSVITAKAIAPLLIIAAVIGLLLARRRLLSWGGVGWSIALCLALGISWGAVSALISPIAAHWWTTAYKVAGLAFCGLALVAAAGGLTADDRARVGKALVAGVVLAVVLLAIEYLGGSLLNIAARPDQWGGFGTLAPHARLSLLKSGAAVTAILIWPAAAFLWRRSGPVAALLLLGVGGIVLAFAAGLAGKLAWVAGALVLSVGLLRFRAAVIGFAALIGLLLLAAPVIPNGYLVPALKSGQITFLPYSVFHRIFIWGYTAERIAERPVAGWGLNAAKQFGASMPPVRMEVELEGRKDWINISEPIPLHPHNAVLQIWLELGFPGVLLAALVLAAVLLAIARLPGASGERAFALATLAAALLVASFSFGIWQNWWMAVLWLVGALTAMSAPKPDGRL